jgi:hypothetical protein
MRRPADRRAVAVCKENEMAVEAGKDFALAKKTTWMFESGVGPATAVVTPTYLFIFPHRAISGRGMTTTRTTYDIGGMHPADAIMQLLADPSTTLDSMEEQLLKWGGDTGGPIVERLDDFKRFRIFTGFIRRNVLFSKKEKGYDIRPTGVRPAKDELQAWVDMLKDRPGVELK